MSMKTFEDFLKKFDELLRQTKDFAKGYKALVDAVFAKLMMERIARHPKFHRNMTADEAGVKAETAAEAEMKPTIEKYARELYCRLEAVPETPNTKQ
jgi:23S rRNA-/tRNA-specific pseudouridylate synthase